MLTLIIPKWIFTKRAPVLWRPPNLASLYRFSVCGVCIYDFTGSASHGRISELLNTTFRSWRSGSMGWQESWDVVRLLGKGGQGSARLVKHKETKAYGVLKTLRASKAKDMKARGRMQREIANLTTLAAMDVKVPAVVENNAEHLADQNVELYFVMEYIEGPTLESYIREHENSRVDWETALTITRQISDTIDAGHQEGIQHRDLKPKNIIVANAPEGPRPYVVDYGLSYYHGIDDDLTACDETLWNEFLTLPETNVEGEDRRDIRSDVCAVGAIAYFCVTGFAPGHPINSQNLPPHRRNGRDFTAVTSDAVALAQLNTTFDRIFHPDLTRRYQTCLELTDALNSIGTALAHSDIDDVESIARQASDLLRANLREVQIRTLKAQAKPAYVAFVKNLGELKLKLDLFTLDKGVTVESMMVSPDGCDNLGMTYGVKLSSSIGELKSFKSYLIVARGMDLVLLTRERNVDTKSADPATTKEMEVIAEGGKFDNNLVQLELKRWISAEIQKMQVVLLEKGDKKTDPILVQLRKRGGY